jgi:hypothetical protein
MPIRRGLAIHERESVGNAIQLIREAGYFQEADFLDRQEDDTTDLIDARGRNSVLRSDEVGRQSLLSACVHKVSGV